MTPARAAGSAAPRLPPFMGVVRVIGLPLLSSLAWLRGCCPRGSRVQPALSGPLAVLRSVMELGGEGVRSLRQLRGVVRGGERAAVDQAVPPSPVDPVLRWRLGRWLRTRRSSVLARVGEL